MGRPPKPEAEVRRNRVVILLTDAELAELHRRADGEGRPIGTTAHALMAGALRKRAKPPR